ncbi:hypothetical protein [Rothia mucilaginosa]|uniref:hypothetical protein n=1 Tax=Rothia mucilaginosa TaxID=43675 RepID=UPI0028D8F31B|nr:hypothetical protein [Rothia mucilaginosa]
MKTRNHQTTRTGLATLSATLMLALSACSGGQSTGESSETTTNAPVATASTSASAASTPTTANASASTTVVAEPKGSEVIEIRADDGTNADSAIAKDAAIQAAKRVVLQEERAVNAWMHGDLEHTSDEELLRFVEPGTLNQVKETLQAARDDLKNNGGPFTGNTSAQNMTVTDVSSVEYSDGSSYPYGYLRVKFCSDWTQVRTPDGKRAVTGSEAQITVEAVVTRTQDGRYLYSGGRKLGNGCTSS